MLRTRGDASEQLPPCAESLMVHSVVLPTAMMTVSAGAAGVLRGDGHRELE